MRTAFLLGLRTRRARCVQKAVSATSVERVPASARPGRVRVVDGEALLLDRVDEVDGRAGQVGPAHLVGDDLHAVERADDIAFNLALVEVQLVAEPRTAAWLD